MPLYGDDSCPVCSQNVLMRISTRHLLSARLLLLLAAALLLLLPGTAFARGVAQPNRSFAHPTRATGKPKPTRATAKPKPGKKAAQRTQRVVIKQVPKRATKRPAKKTAKKTAKPIGSATHEGSTPTTPQAPVGAPPASSGAPAPTASEPTASEPTAPVSPTLVPTVDPSLAQVAQATQDATGNESALIHVIVYGSFARSALVTMGAIDVKDLPLIKAVSGTIAASRLGELGLAAGVTYVAVDSPVKPTDDAAPETTTTTATTTTATAPSPLATLFPQISGATTAWAQGLTGQGIGVAVLDSGVTPSASDLGNRVVQVKIGTRTSVNDSVGHGTFVSDVLAGQSADGRHVGVAPGAKIYALNVNGDNGVTTSDIVAGLSWVISNRQLYNIRVVNLSLAETIPSSYMTSALDQAVEAAWNAGIVVVTTSGNLGPDTMFYAPGNDPFVITVGASDSQDTPDPDDDGVASFSSYGVTGDGFLKPEVMATGRHIVSNVPSGSLLDYQAPDANHVEPGYIMANGTSFAAPQVAGAAALLLQKNPSLTPNQVKWLLAASGRPVNASSAPGLDIVTALAYTGVAQNANQGIAPSTGPATGVLNATQLNSGAAKDAVGLQRAAVRYEADRQVQGRRRRLEEGCGTRGSRPASRFRQLWPTIAQLPTTPRTASSTRLHRPGARAQTSSPVCHRRCSGSLSRSSSRPEHGWRTVPTRTLRS